MKLQFKHQAYQAAAVQAVVDCFKGQQPNDPATRYRIDLGKVKAGQTSIRSLGNEITPFAITGEFF